MPNSVSTCTSMFFFCFWLIYNHPAYNSWQSHKASICLRDDQKSAVYCLANVSLVEYKSL
ncbi:CLUMA_CG009946, isoform A [Clunio marinus]|uniref:CLUMA_CG009946, isoform A n=1 Tax=Clunio marinus TaxID=568069 RepID=A0A1J1IBZ1_9DIPT|nr:CLUMA_CG009946, isoform A [Clunio marinus]